MLRPLINKLAMALATVLVTLGYSRAAAPSAEKDLQWSSDQEVLVSMRDRVHLATDVYFPKGITRKLPTLLVRTPYGKVGQGPSDKEFVDTYLQHGYAVVVQDERGRNFSEGVYKNYLQGASTDGYDTVEWIVKQPWSNGKVGSLGCSSTGETQLPMAASNPPGLAALIPGNAGTAVGNVPGNTTRGAFYRGGVPVLPWSFWYANRAPTEKPQLQLPASQEERIRLRNSYSLFPVPTSRFDPNAELTTGAFELSQIVHLPTKDIVRQGGGALTPFDNYITWTPADPRWSEVELIGSGAKPRVPALHVNTWHDGLTLGEQVRLFKYLQDIGTPNQYLIVGAGPHCAWEARSNELGTDLTLESLGAFAKESPDTKISQLTTFSLDLAHLRFGDLEIGDARYQGIDHGYAKLFSRWFQYWLDGEQNHVLDMPKVQLFVMGKGWISGDQWPLKETRFTKFYLSSEPAGRLTQETGELSTQVPSHNGKDSFVYDPASPTPSRGLGAWGNAAIDQRPVEARKDVVVYSTPPLEKSVTIAGPIEVVLYVSSSAKDTDFMVKLVDVYPDGKAINLADDAFRVRYREGFDKKVLMEPGGVYKITLTNMLTAIRFPQGHRIRLDIASSNFPMFERNLNTGGNNYDETKWVVAENSVHHGGRYPSHVVLPELRDELQ